MLKPPPCPLHREHELGYIQFFEDADRRAKRGEEQQQCPECKRWIWPEFFHVKKPQPREDQGLVT